MYLCVFQLVQKDGFNDVTHPFSCGTTAKGEDYYSLTTLLHTQQQPIMSSRITFVFGSTEHIQLATAYNKIQHMNTGYNNIMVYKHHRRFILLCTCMVDVYGRALPLEECCTRIFVN